MEDILLEMDRILRPEGAVIFRDQVDVLTKVKKLAAGMRWNTKMADHEDGPLVTEKVLYVVKQYWVGGEEDNAEGWRRSVVIQDPATIMIFADQPETYVPAVQC